MTNNPFSKDHDPIFWISDPPHMIKKLWNFLVSPTRDMKFKNREITAQHVLDVLETGVTNIAIQHPSLPVHEVYYTAMYIYHTANYFEIMNLITLEKDYMPKLVRFLVFMLQWK